MIEKNIVEILKYLKAILKDVTAEGEKKYAMSKLSVENIIKPINCITKKFKLKFKRPLIWLLQILLNCGIK
jgi:L-cysteine desulfidase